MNAHRPIATHVAVRDGRILGVGSLEDLQGWGACTLDDRFADHVLMPGLVEGHCHAFEGRVWAYPYLGFYPRHDPEGHLWPGLKTIDAVVQRLQEFERTMATPEAPLFAWGFDPLFYDNRRMHARDLDRVSRTRPIVVIHASFHLLNVNSHVLEKAGISRQTGVEGIVKDSQGDPTGELQELAAKFMAFRVTGNDFYTALTEAELFRFARSACRVGITTATDLHQPLDDATVSAYRAVTSRNDFPLRVLPALATVMWPAEKGVAHVQALQAFNNDKLRFGLVKIMTDGSIQGFTARLKWPGYYSGAPNGVWNMAPAELVRLLNAYHDAGLHIHIHTNGDEASEMMLDAIEGALQRRPRLDHRYTLQHCQMADEAQFQRMKALGVCVNLFANHLYYWGEQHRAFTMGPDRAERMDACGTASRLGVPFAVHSDAPVTPLGPLFGAYCAAARTTPAGRVLGEQERIGVEQALRAVTLGAAYTLHMDGEIGSIEVGKRADFAVLDGDPLAGPAAALKDIEVWGTIVGGEIFPAPGGGA